MSANEGREGCCGRTHVGGVGGVDVVGLGESVSGRVPTLADCATRGARDSVPL